MSDGNANLRKVIQNGMFVSEVPRRLPGGDPNFRC